MISPLRSHAPCPATAALDLRLSRARSHGSRRQCDVARPASSTTTTTTTAEPGGRFLIRRASQECQPRRRRRPRARASFSPTAASSSRTPPPPTPPPPRSPSPCPTLSSASGPGSVLRSPAARLTPLHSRPSPGSVVFRSLPSRQGCRACPLPRPARALGSTRRLTVDALSASFSSKPRPSSKATRGGPAEGARPVPLAPSAPPRPVFSSAGLPERRSSWLTLCVVCPARLQRPVPPGALPLPYCPLYRADRLTRAAFGLPTSRPTRPFVRQPVASPSRPVRCLPGRRCAAPAVRAAC